MKNTENKLLKEGKLLLLVEEFYSIQGEGFNSGKAAYFIRLGGCDINCKWCDSKNSWDKKNHHLIKTDDIIKNAVKYPAKAVVVTGGEPLKHNLNYLCGKLKNAGIKTYLETCGINKISGKWDWLCLSPKKKVCPLPEIFGMINELKIIICDKSDFKWAEENAKRVDKNCKLYLQPEWENKKKTLPLIIDYILKNPKWEISLQIHKYMNIP
ncbi:MAG: 7-carboxy-7-deazaguanine synthase QueE [Bacteroidales bacterium]